MLIPTIIYAQDAFDESALFSDTTTVIALDTSKRHSLTGTQNDPEKTTVGFSGGITSAFVGGVGRDRFGGEDTSNATFGASMIGNLMLDIRLPMDIKSFANLEMQYSATNSEILMSLREIFIDVNINKNVYLRAGKQVLQWGRCNFWNPTDLINVEKKLFIQKIGYREGAYGLRTHIPFGTRANFYGFIDAKDAKSFDSIAVALKAEVLLGGTEVAVSLWDKNSYKPVIGVDFSSKVATLSLSGEVSISKGENFSHLKIRNDTIDLTKNDTLWNGRACVSLSRSFEVLQIKDRLTVALEGYYVSNGYTKNFFEDKTFYRFQKPVVLSQGPSSDTLPAGQALMLLLASGRYEANSYSPWYAAAMANVTKFIIPDLTLTVQSMANISQKCAILATSLSYATMHNLSASLTVAGNVGPKNTEYTFMNQGLSVQATAGITF